MSRLIDADDLMRIVEESMRGNPHKDPKVRANHTTEHQHFCKLIATQPTEYDPEKVIKELSEGLDANVDVDTGEPCNNPCVDCENATILRHIAIVKAGGMNG